MISRTDVLRGCFLQDSPRRNKETEVNVKETEKDIVQNVKKPGKAKIKPVSNANQTGHTKDRRESEQEMNVLVDWMWVDEKNK